MKKKKTMKFLASQTGDTYFRKQLLKNTKCVIEYLNIYITHCEKKKKSWSFGEVDV